MQEGITLTGQYEVRRIDKKTGKILEVEKGHNLVVTDGKSRVRDLIGNIITGGVGFSHVAIGTGTNAVAVGDTELQTETTRASATISALSTDRVVFEHTFTFGTGENYDITEAGIFDSGTITGSVMFDRFKFATAKSVDLDTDLYIKITITVS